MKKDDVTSESGSNKAGCKSPRCYNHGGSNAIYGLGVVGALFYFLQGSTTLGAILLGIGKAFFWPALLMFKLLTYLKM